MNEPTTEITLNSPAALLAEPSKTPSLLRWRRNIAELDLFEDFLQTMRRRFREVAGNDAELIARLAREKITTAVIVAVLLFGISAQGSNYHRRTIRRRVSAGIVNVA